MDNIKIITNNIPRDIVYGYDIPVKVRTDFDYIDAEYFDSHPFILYRGQYYALSEFMRVADNTSMRLAFNGSFKGWCGYQSDTFFSGVLIKWVGDARVIVGRYYS